MKKVKVKNFHIGEGEPLTMMCGPCVIEDETHCLSCAEQLVKIFANTSIQLIFKASFDKANRSSMSSFRGVGLDEGLRILEKVKNTFDIPVVTDFHTPDQAVPVGEVCDILQIPAFLCRQTDLIVAAGRTGKVVSVKKGQFMSPWDMGNIVEKVRSTGNENIILMDRGTSFGYNNLVSDMRGIPAMKTFGFPVCFDASHSVQLPGAMGFQSGGQREYIPTLAQAAVAAGCNCLFMEAHPNPPEAKCDSQTVWPFEELPPLLSNLEKLYAVVCSHES